MKIGTENRKKTIVAIVLLVIGAALVIWNVMPPSGTPAGPATRAASRRTSQRGQAHSPIFSNLDPSLRLDLLKGSEEVAYEGTGHDIFRAKPAPTPTPVIEKLANNVFVPPAPPTPTPPPPIHLKFYGFASNKGDNVKRVFLSEGEYIFVAKEGDIVKGRYRIVRVNPNNIEVEDVLNNNRQAIPLTAS